MEALSTIHAETANTNEDRPIQNSSKDSSSNSSSSDSSFEDSSDQGQNIEDALRHNIELMNKREELGMGQVQCGGFRTVVYDASAKMVRYGGWEL